MAYSKLGPFIDVPESQRNNPPAGAKALSADTMNHIEDGVGAAQDTADAATAAAAAKAPLTGVEGIKTHDGTAGGGTRPTGYARVRWVGGTARPTNMVTGDIWERDA